MTTADALKQAWVERITDCITNLNNSATIANSMRIDDLTDRLATVEEALAIALTMLEGVQRG